MQNKTETPSRQLTLCGAVALVKQAERLFNLAASAWINGNNSGNNIKLADGLNRCARLRGEAELLLRPFGITCDYPGLFPSFKVNGYDHHSVLSALSNVLEVKVKEVA